MCKKPTTIQNGELSAVVPFVTFTMKINESKMSEKLNFESKLIGKTSFCGLITTFINTIYTINSIK